MKAICNKKVLCEALGKAKLCLSKGLSILSYFRVDAFKNSLCFTATNLEETIEAWCEAEVEGYDKSFCISGEKLFSIVKKLPEDEVGLSLERVLCVKSGKARFSLTIMDVEEFPEIDIPEFKDKIDLVNFIHCLNRVSFCAAQGYERETLKSVLLGKHIVATDGRRLAYMPYRWGGESIIIPSAFVNLLEKVVGDWEGEYAVYGNRFALRFGNTILMTQLVDGKFPDWESVLPNKDKLDKVYVINKENFERAIKRVSLMSEKETRLVRLKFSGGKLLLHSHCADGQGEEEIEVEGDKEFEIGFNAVYLLEGLKRVNSEKLVIKCEGSMHSALFEPQDNTGWRYLIMPVRLREE